MAKRRFTREQFLNAARAIATERGAGHVTIEAVAGRVGATKGGLLHNFPSKQALVEALIADLCADWDRLIAAETERHGSEPAAALRGYVAAYAKADEFGPAFVDALLVGLAENPALLDPIKEAYRKYRAAIEAEAGDVDLARLVWLAAEGIGFLEMMGLHRFERAERQALFARLEALAGAAARPGPTGGDR